jgi:hypothetical protein
MSLVNSLSWNVHGQSLSGSEQDNFVAMMIKSQPTVIVVMDEIKLALRLKQSLLNTVVIFRNNTVGGNDNAHNDFTPAEVVKGYEPAWREGLVIYVSNEPGFNRETIAWTEQVLEIANTVGAKCCVLNLSPGVPEEVDLPLADNLLRMIVNGGHTLGVHEGGYDVLESGFPDFLGRSLRFLQHVKSDRRFIVSTEFGWAPLRVDGQLKGDAIVPLLDVWRSRGEADPEAYAFEQIKRAWERVYAPSGAYLGLCIYSYGDASPPRWRDYDYRRLPRLVNMISSYRYERVFDMPQLGDYIIKVQNSSKYMNFRTAASTTAPLASDGKVYDGERVYVTGDPVIGGEYVWLPIDREVQGFLAWRKGDVELFTLEDAGRYHDLLSYLATSAANSPAHTLNTSWAGDGEHIQIQRDGGRFYIVKGHQLINCNYESLWADRHSIYRDLDSSPGGDEVYLINQGRGAKWLSRFMKVGDTFLFNPEFNWRKKSTGAPIAGRESVRLPHTLKFIAAYDEYRFASGIVLHFVVEFASTLSNGQPFERYWYASGRGLVAWRDESGSSKNSHISGFAPDKTLLQREDIKWWRPEPKPGVDVVPVPVPPVEPPPPPVEPDVPLSVTVTMKSGRKFEVKF